MLYWIAFWFWGSALCGGHYRDKHDKRDCLYSGLLLSMLFDLLLSITAHHYITPPAPAGGTMGGISIKFASGDSVLLLNSCFVFCLRTILTLSSSLLWLLGAYSRPFQNVEDRERPFCVLISPLTPISCNYYFKFSNFIFWSHHKSFGEGDGIWIRDKVVTDVHYKTNSFCWRKTWFRVWNILFLGKGDSFLLLIACMHFMNLRCH